MTPVTTKLDSYRDTAIHVVREVFRTMLRVEARPSDGDGPERLSHPVIGAVYLAGGWRGAFLLELEREDSYQLAARLMAIEPPQSVDDDVRDTIAELTNMIAGNLKSMLQCEVLLSMPSVIEGSDFTLKVIGDTNTARLGFDCELGPFWLTLVQVFDS